MWRVRVLALPVVAFICASTELSHAQSTILSSDSPRWLAGDYAPEGDLIAPRSNETVRVMSDNAITSVTAPERYVVGRSERPEDIEILAGMLTDIRILAEDRRWMRDGGVPSLPPSLWAINFTLGGTYCFTSAGQLRLWRPLNDQEIELQISDPDKQWDVFVPFRSGDASKPWPSLPDTTEDGAGPFVFSSDAITDAEITTARIKGGTALDTLLALSAKGCDYQLFLLTQGLTLDTSDER